MTQDIQEALRVSVRTAYGHAYKIVFYVTIPFSVFALVCSFFVEDATEYMTNHIQFVMSRNMTTHRRQNIVHAEKAEDDHVYVETKQPTSKRLRENLKAN